MDQEGQLSNAEILYRAILYNRTNFGNTRYFCQISDKLLKPLDPSFGSGTHFDYYI